MRLCSPSVLAMTNVDPCEAPNLKRNPCKCTHTYEGKTCIYDETLADGQKARLSLHLDFNHISGKYTEDYDSLPVGLLVSLTL